MWLDKGEGLGGAAAMVDSSFAEVERLAIESEEGALKGALKGGESGSGGAKMRSWLVGFAIEGL